MTGLRRATAAALAQVIRERGHISESGVTLETFRDLYNLLQGDSRTAGLRWILLFLGDQVVAQPLGQPEVLLILCAKDGRHLSRSEFSFIPDTRGLFTGSTNGKYRFRSFLKEIFGLRLIIGIVAAWDLMAIASYELVPPAVQLKVSEALISALSIFVSIFTLFVLSVDTEREYRYLREGRYHKLTQSDKYIGLIGVSALLIAIVAAGVGAADLSAKLPRILLAASSSAALILTLGSFWLVLTYHFGRKHQMAEFLMAQQYLSSIQATAQAKQNSSVSEYETDQPA